MDEAELYRERKSPRHDQFEKIQESVGTFGRYQWITFGAANIAYLSITGSLLCNVYDNVKPTRITCELDNSTFPCSCENGTNNNLITSLEFDFYSLLIHLGLHCAHGYIPTVMTTAVMVGGVMGAVVFGHLADRFGRKIICEITLLGCILTNFVLIASNTWVFASIILICMGFFGGAYMVVNMVFVLEIVGAKWRLFCVTFNGWPLGLMSMALVGYVTRDWRYYHATVAVCGIPSLFVFIFYLRESPRWLIQHNQLAKARESLLFIAKANHLTEPIFLLDDTNDIGINLKMKNLEESCGEIVIEEVEILQQQRTTEPAKKPSYSYLDLVRHKSVFCLVVTMFYSWFASSTISFSIYFNVGTLAGDRFLNTFLMGLLKGLTGCIPLAIGSCMGRRPVIITAALVTCVSCWIAVILSMSETLDEEELSLNNATLSSIDPNRKRGSLGMTILALIGAGAIDPIWKINHLYSAELFPTVIRNMARGVCNVGSRVGSVIAPQISYLQEILFPLPYVIFGVLSTIHVIVCILFLPETRGAPMPDSLPKADKGGHNDLHRIPIAHWWSTKKSLKAVKNTIDEN